MYKTSFQVPWFMRPFLDGAPHTLIPTYDCCCAASPPLSIKPPSASLFIYYINFPNYKITRDYITTKHSFGNIDKFTDKA